MKLLCLDVPSPGSSLEKLHPHLVNEAKYAWKLYKSGVIREIYFRQDRPGVAILAEADSVDAAKKELGEFPLAKAGLIGWEVIPLGSFANWEMLFAKA